ncbi:MAG: hypothetical protein ACRD6W_02670 [Nitrososphaerales archaeon]
MQLELACLCDASGLQRCPDTWGRKRSGAHPHAGSVEERIGDRCRGRYGYLLAGTRRHDIALLKHDRRHLRRVDEAKDRVADEVQARDIRLGVAVLLDEEAADALNESAITLILDRLPISAKQSPRRQTCSSRFPRAAAMYRRDGQDRGTANVIRDLVDDVTLAEPWLA